MSGVSWTSPSAGVRSRYFPSPAPVPVAVLSIPSAGAGRGTFHPQRRCQSRYFPSPVPVPVARPTLPVAASRAVGAALATYDPPGRIPSQDRLAQTGLRALSRAGRSDQRQRLIRPRGLVVNKATELAATGEMSQNRRAGSQLE